IAALIYVPDAALPIVELARYGVFYGERWNVPGLRKAYWTQFRRRIPMKIHVHQRRARGGGALLAGGLLGLAVACSSSEALGAVNVLERSYNQFRTGANTVETVLTPSNVKSSANRFHKQFVMKVDGKIEGSPLYASGVTIAGGTHNVVYTAT